MMGELTAKMAELNLPDELQEVIEVTVEEDRHGYLHEGWGEPEETLGHAGWTPYLFGSALLAWDALSGADQAELDRLATVVVIEPEQAEG